MSSDLGPMSSDLGPMSSDFGPMSSDFGPMSSDFGPKDDVDPNGFYGLPSPWSSSLLYSPTGVLGRFEGEVADLPVFGSMPKELNGTFYRIMVDPFYPLQEGNPPVEGDGNVCALRIQNGRVDLKSRYVDTERLSLERQAGRRLFGLYRNPFSHHPCVRAAVDSTANTNVVYWAGRLLALKESSQPYAVDADTLETLAYDPFKCPGKTFSAHPKHDPDEDELVCYGYEAKGLGTRDIVHFALDRRGNVLDERWISAPYAGLIHDCAVTKNFIILVIWPFEADMEGMKTKEANHWKYGSHLPATFIVSPRRSSFAPPGWKPGEYRVYIWDHAILMHTAGAWEEAQDNKIYVETSRVFYNPLPQFGTGSSNGTEAPPPPAPPPLESKFIADYVRWELDLNQPDGSRVVEPTVILDQPSEMARIDERFLTRPYRRIFLPVIVPRKSPLPPMVPIALNAYVALDNASGKHAGLFDPGPNCTLEEPVFIPRSADSPEGDGWLLGMIQRFDVQRSDLVVLDTRDFARPVAVVQLPFKTKGQIHGNWVEHADTEQNGDTGPPSGSARSHAPRHFVRPYTGVPVSGRGALEAE